MNPLAIPLPIAVRRTGETVGILAGLACFPIALYAGSLEFILPSGPAALVLPIVMASAIAGACASAIADPTKAPEIGGVPLRVGARAGFIASLVGGAVTVLASTLHFFGIGTPGSVETAWGLLSFLLPASVSVRVVALALLALPPSIFFGLTGALLVGMAKGEPPGAGGKAHTGSAQRPERSLVFIGAFILAAACYLSPLAVLFRANAAALGANLVQRQAPRSTSQPKWRYTKPAGFDAAEADRIVFSEKRVLGPVSQHCPVAISPDGRRIAYCRSDTRPRIYVTDLETLDEIAIQETPEQPGRFSWSPDSKMLLIVTEGLERQMMILDLNLRHLHVLPQPLDQRVPLGRPFWWESQDVIFPTANPPVVLSLSNLRLRPIETSAKWSGMSEADREEVKRKISQLPSNIGWQMRPESAVRRYIVPPGGNDNWLLEQRTQVAYVHPLKSYRYLPAALELADGDSIFASEDGTKVVRIRQDEAIVYYFVERPSLGKRFTVAMPSTPELSLGNAQEEKQVAAFICAPLINPLNGITVGPDPKHVKAIARPSSWQGKTAEFWIAEEYEIPQPGDVVADIHTWAGNNPHPAGALGRADWFALIDKFNEGTEPPLQGDVSSLNRSLVSTTDSQTRPSDTEQADSPPREPPPTSSSSTVSSSSPSDAALRREVQEFIKDHHAKATRGDLDGLASDYAEHVAYMNHGYVTREFVLNDERAYHAPGVRVSETLIAPPLVVVRTNSVWASYSIYFLRQSPDGKWTKGIGDISLTINPTPPPMKITEQHIKILEKQQGP